MLTNPDNFSSPKSSLPSLKNITKEMLKNTIDHNILKSLAQDYLEGKYQRTFTGVTHFKGLYFPLDVYPYDKSKQFINFLREIWMISMGLFTETFSDLTKEKKFDLQKLVKIIINEQEYWDYILERAHNLIDDDIFVGLNDPNNLGDILLIFSEMNNIQGIANSLSTECMDVGLFRDGLSIDESDDFLGLLDKLDAKDFFNIVQMKANTYCCIVHNSQYKTKHSIIEMCNLTNFRYNTQEDDNINILYLFN